MRLARFPAGRNRSSRRNTRCGSGSHGSHKWSATPTCRRGRSAGRPDARRSRTGRPAGPGRSRVGGRGWRAFELEGELVHVAPEPVLARLIGADDRVANRTEVGGGVSSRRVVAAPHVAALLTNTEMDPV